MNPGKTISTLIALLFCTSLLVQGQNREITRSFHQHEIQSWNNLIGKSVDHRVDENIDVKFYHLEIEIAIDSAYIIGELSCRLEPKAENLEEIRFNLDRSLTVDGVGEQADGFFIDGDEVVIQLDDSYNPGDEVTVSIYYQGVPVMAGGYKGLRYEFHNGNEPIIATLSTPFVAHYWYPCKDGPEDKADSVYVDVTIDNQLVNGIEMMVVSNGTLEDVIASGDKNTFRWRHRYPIVTYYVMVAISNYVHFTDEFESNAGTTVPLDYYAFNEVLQEQQAGVSDLPLAMKFFEDTYGAYPFAEEKYGMTQLGYYGGIENQTNTIINSMSMDWFMVSVHELAHMWFADMITCQTWNHAWLNEGFATYSEALWAEEVGGEEAYNDYMDELKYYNGGTIYLENPLDTFNVFTGIIYYKGAWALHMLRGIVGDSLFFESINNYALDENFMYQNAITEDLKNVFESTTGSNLDFYFDQWIYDEYYPIYHYNFVQHSNKLFVSLYQAQEELYGRRAVFEMPVDLKINFTDGSDTTITVWNDEQMQQFEFEIDESVYSVLVDPDEWILRKVYYKNDLPVGTDELAVNYMVTLYPNPASGIINVVFNSNDQVVAEIKIYNQSGKEIKSQLLSDRHSVLKIDDLSSGIYFYKISGQNSDLPVKGKFIKR